MTLAGWLVALAVGLLAGTVSGLIGIGGGAVMVPFLYFFLSQPDLSGVVVPAAEQAVIAHATSLLVIVPVSLRGAWLYQRAGLVDRSTIWRMGLASVVTAVIGARVAVAVPGELLKAAFGVFLLVVAVRLAIGRRPEKELAKTAARALTVRALVGGSAVGFFSALLGVGGGLVAIPVLLYWLHLPIRQVSGTSLAVITFTALVGVATYAVSGFAEGGSGAGGLAYIHLPASLALAVGAVGAVPWGTRMQQRVPARALQRLFALAFFLLGARIVVANLLRLLSG